MAQLVEHILGKDEVPGPNPGSSSKKTRSPFGLLVFFVFGAATIGLDPAPRALGRSGIRSAYPATERVELARKRQGAGIFANGEYLGINESYYLSLAPSNKIVRTHAVKIA